MKQFNLHMAELYAARKKWIYNGVQQGFSKAEKRIEFHLGLARRSTLPPARYSSRYAHHLSVVMSRSKPKHIHKHREMQQHIDLILRRKKWKRLNSHTGPLFWRAFW